MARKPLTAAEIAAFRNRLCSRAIRLFATHGHGGVTLRALANELGVSPMMPYRYFRSKDDMLAAAREAAFRRFADGQALAFASTDDSVGRIRALVNAYFRFAIENPDDYRIMFELRQPGQERFPELQRAFRKAYRPVRIAVARAIDERVLSGDADTVAHMIWSSCHGLASLHLSGMLVLGRTIDELEEPMLREVFRGEAPATKRARRKPARSAARPPRRS